MAFLSDFSLEMAITFTFTIKLVRESIDKIIILCVNYYFEVDFHREFCFSQKVFAISHIWGKSDIRDTNYYFALALPTCPIIEGIEDAKLRLLYF